MSSGLRRSRTSCPDVHMRPSAIGGVVRKDVNDRGPDFLTLGTLGK